MLSIDPCEYVKEFCQILTLKRLSNRGTKNGKMSFEMLIYARQRGVFTVFVLSLYMLKIFTKTT